MKKFLIIFTVIATFVYFAPWVLYRVGLSNLSGRPSKPKIEKLDEAKSQKIWKLLNENGPVEFESLTPWHYAFQFIGLQKEKMSPGERTAYFVARAYASNNLKNRKMIYWHLSSTSLTIWLTRNWSGDQILSKAFEIKTLKSAFN